MAARVDKLAYLCIMRVRIRNQQTESTMINDVISPEFDENGRAMRRIRSFVRRQGRLTKGQQLALDNYWPVMGVEYQPTLLISLPCLAVKRQWYWKSVLAWEPHWSLWLPAIHSRIFSG